MRSTFKILFYLKKGSEKPNGKLPLMCRLIVDCEIKQFSCKLNVPPALWDIKAGRASGKSTDAQKINIVVDRIRVDINRRYHSHAAAQFQNSQLYKHSCNRLVGKIACRIYGSGQAERRL